MTEDAASPSPGMTWSGILGALRQGNTPDGAASLDRSGESAESPDPYTLKDTPTSMQPPRR